MGQGRGLVPNQKALSVERRVFLPTAPLRSPKPLTERDANGFSSLPARSRAERSGAEPGGAEPGNMALSGTWESAEE